MRTSDILPASPKKLRSGEWGAFVKTSEVGEGDRIQVMTKAGKTWTTRVQKVVWTGYDQAIVATKKQAGGSLPKAAEADDHDCSCHKQKNAGAPGTILFDGCNKCGCEAA